MKELVAEGGRLRLDTNEDGWCRIELVSDGNITPLGADVYRIVAERLSRALSSSPEESSMSGGERNVACVTTLSEHHCTIYAYDEEGDRILFVQDRHGQDIGTLRLPDPHRRRWRDQLRA